MARHEAATGGSLTGSRRTRRAPVFAAGRGPTADNLRGLLRDIDYTESGLRALLGTQGAISLRPASIPVHLRRLQPGSPLSTVIRLFLLGAEACLTDAAAAFAGVGVDELVRVGLLEAVGDRVRSPYKLVPYDGLLFASDRTDPRGPGLADDHVTGVNPTSVALSNITPRHSVGSVLDLGAGCGVQAILASRQASSVVATDVNARALQFVEFNALLNGCSGVEARKGSLFAPVRQEKFDLIVCNPPYVISPDSTFMFRDGGQTGDALCKAVVDQTPEHLGDGGFGVVLCNWAVGKDGDWSRPLSEWARDAGCDILLLRGRSEDPLTYAARWTDPDLTISPEDRSESLDRWVRYYESLGIEAIASGAVVIRRKGGSHWRRAMDGAAFGPVPVWGHVKRLFDAQDFLSGNLDARALAAEAFVLTDDHRIDQTVVCRDGGLLVESTVLRLGLGLGFTGKLDGTALRLLSRLDGHRSVGEVLADGQGGAPSSAEVADATLAVVRRLYEYGFLVRTERLGKDHPL